jgi:tetratricopeptide (TPR) repeat protein
MLLLLYFSRSNTSGKSRKTYTNFIKYKKYIDRALISTKALLYYNTGVNLLITRKWKKGIELFSKIISLPIITKHYYHSYNNMGICYQKIGKNELAIESFKKRVDDPTDYMVLKKCYTNILSSTSDMNNEILMKNTLILLEGFLKNLESEIIYQTYWNLGKAYLKLGEQKKAIKSFEKELSFPILTNKINVRVEKYLDSIEQLLYLYGLNSIKQQELIEILVKIPTNLVFRGGEKMKFKYLFILLILFLSTLTFSNEADEQGDEPVQPLPSISIHF